ncbi:CG17260 [Drosophila busckii]|uniref:CG17260 n=2 Tax=Drosophila busckii TaxID=30019 RepID=A0A0M3QTB8_DROBS|nr:CG17260 [Drosophila busckii]
MELLQDELEYVRTHCEQQFEGSKLVACTSSLVRVELLSHRTNRTMIVCLHIPKDYPQSANILVELKSRVYAEKLISFLTDMLDKCAKQHCGEPQVMQLLRTANQYLVDTPLCVCLDEITQLRSMLAYNDENKLKLRQSKCSVQLLIHGGEYFYRVTATVPDNYPQHCVELHDHESNLPNVLVRFLNGQSKELARQCVEAPLRFTRDEQAKFRPVPSLYTALKFCIAATQDFHMELCPICDQAVLPTNPEEILADENADAFVERVFCGHLFHQGCLKKYLSEPPFPKGGKLCPAKRRHPRSDAAKPVGASGKDKGLQAELGVCGIKLAHDRWVVNIKTAETRWAQKQARQRELEEVVDFLK